MKLLASVLLPLIVSASFFAEDAGEGENWAVLLAGAKDWINYRYQADVSHAYQVLRSNGIPEDHIIVMLYDDVANHPLNIHPGKLFNEVGGDDVYTGMPKDYTGEDVTQETFFKVLRGDEQGLSGIGSGRALKSGPNDRIFLSMDDHGSPGCFYFPGFVPMTAVDFAEVLLEMHGDGKFKELMIYMEACEAGTMFEDLYPAEVRLYAGTSSNAEESSWACEYDEEMAVWLACEFPLGWMRDTETNDPSVRTLQEQYENVRDGITRAHVSQYGNLDVAQQVVGNFLGNRTTKQREVFHHEITETSSVRTQDAELVLLERQLLHAVEEKEIQNIRMQIKEFLKNRELLKESTKRIALMVTGGDELLAEEMMVKRPMKITNWECYGPAIHAFHSCFTEEERKHAPLVVHTLLALCEGGFHGKDVLSAIDTVCDSH